MIPEPSRYAFEVYTLFTFGHGLHLICYGNRPDEIPRFILDNVRQLDLQGFDCDGVSVWVISLRFTGNLPTLDVVRPSELAGNCLGDNTARDTVNYGEALKTALQSELDRRIGTQDGPLKFSVELLYSLSRFIETF